MVRKNKLRKTNNSLWIYILFYGYRSRYIIIFLIKLIWKLKYNIVNKRKYRHHIIITFKHKYGNNIWWISKLFYKWSLYIRRIKKKYRSIGLIRIINKYFRKLYNFHYK